MQNPYLEFTAGYFSKIGIATNIVTVDETLGDHIDKGLRKALFKNSSDSVLSFDNIDPDFVQNRIIYFAEDMFTCRYILIPLPDDAQPLIMLCGPYLYEAPGITRTQDLCKRLSIPQGMTGFLNQYFTALPYIENASSLEYFTEVLGDKLFGSEIYKMEYLIQHPTGDHEYIQTDEITSTEDTMKQLEHRYEIEEKMMDAISRGDFNSAMRYSTDKALSGVDNRASSTLRSHKNNLFVVNTLCRKAAQRGNVHPLYLDDLSRKMSIRIENMTGMNEDKDVHREMLRKYCMLVQKNSTTGYSPLMQKILNHISQHLNEQELTLSSTASALSLNKSYLAGIFKKETGETFTSYVNFKRIDHAIFLLNTTNHQIQVIAATCGIPDMTYFTRIFKKLKGMTPTRYRQMIVGNSPENI